MKIIGLTGGVGSGKTQIMEYLNNKYGATICQTDKVAKRAENAMMPLSHTSDRRSWMRKAS